MKKFVPAEGEFRELFHRYYKAVKNGCTPIVAGRMAAEIYEEMCKHFQKALKKELKKMRKKQSEWRS